MPSHVTGGVYNSHTTTMPWQSQSRVVQSWSSTRWLPGKRGKARLPL